MKLYVLDEALAPGERRDADVTARPRFRRPLIAAAVLVPLALGAGYLYCAAVSDRSAEVSPGPYLASGPAAAVVPPTDASASRLAETPATAAYRRIEPAKPTSAEASSVVKRDGKYFVDLHSVEVATALAMVSHATGMKVVGSDALLVDHPVLLTTKLVVASPLAAWQSVFGDIANFAVSCASKTCVVHIVSAASPGGQAVAADSQVTRTADPQSAPVTDSESTAGADSQSAPAAVTQSVPVANYRYGMAATPVPPAPGATVYSEEN